MSNFPAFVELGQAFHTLARRLEAGGWYASQREVRPLQRRYPSSGRRHPISPCSNCRCHPPIDETVLDDSTATWACTVGAASALADTTGCALSPTCQAMAHFLVSSRQPALRIAWWLLGYKCEHDHLRVLLEAWPLALVCLAQRMTQPTAIRVDHPALVTGL